MDETGNEVVEPLISSDTNILESSYSENAEEVINRVKICDEKDQYLGVVEDKELIDLVGVFQDVYTKEQDKQAGTVASNMLKGIDKCIEISTIGNVEYRTGRIVKIQDSATKIEQLFDITGDSHTWNNSHYETKLVLDVVEI